MIKYFSLEFTDLEWNKRQEMISEVKEALLEKYKEEAEHGQFGKNFGRKEYQGMSWQEAICREYDIDYQMWETEEEAKKFDWNLALEEKCEEEADEKCLLGMHNTIAEMEV